jgi:hypothetical protein
MSSTRVTWSGKQGATGSLRARNVPWLSADVIPWLYMAAALCLIGALGFVHVGQASHVAGLIEDMEGLEADLYDLKQQNNALRLQIAEHEQMSDLKERALAMGFVEAESIEYVVVVVDELHSSAGDGGGADVGRAGGGSPPSLPVSWHGVLQQFTNWMGLAQARSSR